MIAMPVSDLPAPDSPTTPSTSPRLDGEGHVVDGDQRAAPGRELDPQVVHFEQRWLVGHADPHRQLPQASGLAALSPAEPLRGVHRSLGFNTSRSQSPSRLTDNTSTTSAMPGNTAIHHSPENR